jgi:hypothetical protein
MEFNGISMTPHNVLKQGLMIVVTVECRRCCRVERENGKELF